MMTKLSPPHDPIRALCSEWTGNFIRLPSFAIIFKHDSPTLGLMRAGAQKRNPSRRGKLIMFSAIASNEYWHRPRTRIISTLCYPVVMLHFPAAPKELHRQDWVATGGVNMSLTGSSFESKSSYQSPTYVAKCLSRASDANSSVKRQEHTLAAPKPSSARPEHAT